MDKAYNPQLHEKDIYQNWLSQKAGYYGSLNPDVDSIQSFIMPPPNLTGSLHLGHVLEHSIYDSYLRYYTINGSPAVFLPGVDHAGIQMEGTIEKQLKKEGTSKDEIGYEAFMQRTWDFATKSKDNIKMIAQAVGELPAWDKMHFTMDDASTKAARSAFFDYWQRGWVYKGAQMVNWSVGLQTAVSEVFGDIEWEERKDPLVTFEYEAARFEFSDKIKHQIGEQVIKGPHPSIIMLAANYLKPCSEWPRLQLSTVRMETKFTDVAIAMHPSKFGKFFNLESIFNTDLAGFDADLAQSFLDLIQSNYIEIFYHLPPLQSEDVKLILSEKVLEDFGTGVLKITPGHDPFDYEFYLDAADKNLLDGSKEIQQAVGRDGKLTELCGEFAGLTVDESRPLVIKKLIEAGYIPKRTEDFNGRTKTTDLPEVLRDIEDILEYDIDWEYSHNVQLCERSKTVIEPLISTEWFVQMTAENGIRDNALRKLNTTQEITFYPARFKDQATEFISKLKDWVISRNLWWGHRFPVWYCDDCNPNHEFFKPDQFVEDLSYNNNSDEDGKAWLPPKGFLIWPHQGRPAKCPCCNSSNLVQEERVLDTWFSSSLWPLIMTGFDFEAYLSAQHVFEKYPYLKVENSGEMEPNLARTKFLKSLNGELHESDPKLFTQAYPSQMLTCASEIFNIWVCRMIMLGYHFTDQPPFKNMFVHAVVRDEKGRKFSKSLGNGIEPQDLLDKYSADSVRMALNSQIVPGRDILMSQRTAEELAIKWRNFGNKLWNVARFLQERLGGATNSTSITSDQADEASIWILNRFVDLMTNVESDMTNYRLGQVMDNIYEFVWNDLADWYVEYLKTSPNQLQFAQNNILIPLIQLLHPFIPFETELLWQELCGSEDSILSSRLPEILKLPENNEFGTIKEFVISFRKLRGLYRIDPVTKTKVYSDNKLLHKYREFLSLVARVDILSESTSQDSHNFYSENWSGIEFRFDLIGLILEPSKEISQSEKDLELVDREIGKLQGLLNNQGFLDKAGEETIIKTKNDFAVAELKQAQLQEKIKWLSSHLS